MAKKRTTAYKRRGMKLHACQRARERYGANLTVEDIDMLNRVIKLGLARRIPDPGALRGGLKFFVTTLDRQVIPVIFHNRMNCVATVIPPQSWAVRRAASKQRRSVLANTSKSGVA